MAAGVKALTLASCNSFKFQAYPTAQGVLSLVTERQEALTCPKKQN
jgi:hypothetical protein